MTSPNGRSASSVGCKGIKINFFSFLSAGRAPFCGIVKSEGKIQQLIEEITHNFKLREGRNPEGFEGVKMGNDRM